MPYGYVGDISDKIKQSKKNNGVLTVNEIADLQTDGSWGGSLELIDGGSKINLHSGDKVKAVSSVGSS